MPARQGIVFPVCLGCVGFFLLPWYGTEGGFFSFGWLNPDYPWHGDAPPAFFLLLTGKSGWLGPVVALLLLPLSGLLPGQSAHSRAVLLVAAGSVGLLYLAAQGLLLGSDGWQVDWLAGLTEASDIRQGSMGTGAFAAAVAFILLLTGGMAQRGFAGGDGFVSGATGFLAAGILVFVFYPLTGLFVAAADTLTRIADEADFWSLACFSASGPCGAAWNSLILAVSVGLMTVLFGLILALTVTRTDFDAKSWLLTSLELQSLLPPFLSGLALLLLFGLSGTLNQYISGLFETQPKDWIIGFPGLLIAQTIAFLPLSFFLIGGRLAALSQALDRSAETLGASSLQALRTITMPLMRQTLGLAFLISALQSLADLGNPLILAGSFNVLSLEIYRVALGPESEPGRAAVAALILFLPALAGFWVFRPDHALTGIGEGSGSYAFKPSWKLPTGLVRLFCITAVFWLIFSALIPATLFASGFIDVKNSVAPTVGHYVAAFSLTLQENGIVANGYAWPSLFKTVAISLVASSFATVLGFLIAYLLLCGKLTSTKVASSGLTLVFAVPGVTLGVAFVYGFDAPPIDLARTQLILVTGLTILTVPVAVRCGAAALSQTDAHISDTLAAMGAGSFLLFWQITFYALSPAVWMTLIHCFIRAAAALTIILFLARRDGEMATTVIMGQIENQDYAAAAAYASVLIILLSGISVVSYLIRGKRIRRTVPAPVLT